MPLTALIGTAPSTLRTDWAVSGLVLSLRVPPDGGSCWKTKCLTVFAPSRVIDMVEDAGEVAQRHGR